MMPSSIFIMDPLGNCVAETGRLWETGDHDHQCHLLSGTLVPIPVGDGRHGQSVMTIEGKDELDPRTVLARQVERFTRTSADRVEWSVTVNDPSTWTRPWTFSMPLTKTDSEPVLEFACHEGNYAVPHILAGARAAEAVR